MVSAVGQVPGGDGGHGSGALQPVNVGKLWDKPCQGDALCRANKGGEGHGARPGVCRPGIMGLLAKPL
jgi:hypothetical protein